jgi:polysaccharide pyruvyl transferase WcaK-like protein
VKIKIWPSKLAKFEGPQKSTSRLVIFWWGSFHLDGTIGDEASAKALYMYLRENGHKVDVVSWKSLNWVEVINAPQLDYASYSKIIFVCGPILPNYPPLEELLAKAKQHNLTTIGFSVSLFKNEDGTTYIPFDVIFPRESPEGVGVDLAVLNSSTQAKQIKNSSYKIGLVLRGWQKEYGAENCDHQFIDSLVKEALEKFSTHNLVQLIDIDHQLSRSQMNLEEYDSIYGSCDLIITTRFHGGIFAIRNLIPVLILDQIRPFGKVTRLFDHIDYPYKYLSTEIELANILDFLSADHQNTRLNLIEIRNREVQRASEFLKQIDFALEESSE